MLLYKQIHDSQRYSNGPTINRIEQLKILFISLQIWNHNVK